MTDYLHRPQKFEELFCSRRLQEVLPVIPHLPRRLCRAGSVATRTINQGQAGGLVIQPQITQPLSCHIPGK